MNMCGDKIEFPLTEDILLLDKLSNKMKVLRGTSTQPDNFFDQAIQIEEHQLPIENNMKIIYESLSDAVNAFHTSKLCTEYCVNNSLYVKGKQWYQIHNAVSNLGIDTYITEQKEIVTQKRLLKVNFLATNIDPTSKVIDITMDKDTSNLILAKDGSMVEVDSVFKRGKTSEQCRERRNKNPIRGNVLIHKG